MLRTDSKKARENVRAYIMAGYNPEFTGTGNGDEIQAGTFEEVAAVVYDCFALAEWHSETSKRFFAYNEFKAFEYWCSGLPGVIDTDYYLSKAVDTLGDILEETETERSRYTETAAEQLLTRLIFREIKAAAGVQ